MSYEARIRTGVFLAGVFFALYLPWWVTPILILCVLLRFRAWEALVLALCVDLIYMPLSSHWPLFLIGTICVAWLLEPLRSAILP
ncbi:hypothetical protein HY968_03790 [Candidatus Kaiserbacteria bacterium]|nr:hypothetical protein [Candidatus Kaiserbacteria bacterium]